MAGDGDDYNRGYNFDNDEGADNFIKVVPVDGAGDDGSNNDDDYDNNGGSKVGVSDGCHDDGNNAIIIILMTVTMAW